MKTVFALDPNAPQTQFGSGHPESARGHLIQPRESLTSFADRSPLGPLPIWAHSASDSASTSTGAALSPYQGYRRPRGEIPFARLGYIVPRGRMPGPPGHLVKYSRVISNPQLTCLNPADPYPRPFGQLRPQAVLARYQQNAPALASLIMTSGALN
jgi:hypothetical protein